MKTFVSAVALSFLGSTSFAAVVPSELQGTTDTLTYSFDAEVTEVNDFAAGPSSGFGAPTPVAGVTPFLGLSVGDVVPGLFEVELKYGAGFVDVLSFGCSIGGFNCTYGSYLDDSFLLKPEDVFSGTGSYSSTDFIDGSDLVFGEVGGSLKASESWAFGGDTIREIDLSFSSYEVTGLPHMPVPASLGFAFVASAAFMGMRALQRKNSSR